METKLIKLDDLIPVIRETLDEGGSFEININGTSMLPLLKAGRDTVTLSPVTGNLKKYDIPLFQRADGAYVLHRIIKAGDGIYTVCGDNQWKKETGITQAQIIAAVSEIKRGGRTVSVDSFGYKLYCRVWHLLFPVRKYIVKAKGKLAK